MIIESPQNLELGIYLLFHVLQSYFVLKLIVVPFLFCASVTDSQALTLGRVSQSIKRFLGNTNRLIMIIESPQNLELGIYLLFRVLQSNVGCKQLLAVPFLFHASGISQPRCNTWEGEPEKDFLSRQTSFQKKCTVEP